MVLNVSIEAFWYTKHIFIFKVFYLFLKKMFTHLTNVFLFLGIILHMTDFIAIILPKLTTQFCKLKL